MHIPLISNVIACFKAHKAQPQPTNQRSERSHIQHSRAWAQTRKCNVFLATQGVQPHQIFKDTMANKYNPLYFSPSLKDVKALQISGSITLDEKGKGKVQEDDDLCGEYAEDFPIDAPIAESSKSLVHRINQRLNPFTKQDSERFLLLSITEGLSSLSSSTSSLSTGSSWIDPLWVVDDQYRKPKETV